MNTQKHKYKGGLVLDPVPGIHKYVICLDFSSLYPTIIQEYKICFTENNILPKIVTRLVNARNQIKNQMFYAADDKILHEKQNLLKKTANSLYGSLGCEYFRFFSHGIAEKIAKTGREVLTNTVNIATQLCLKVIYGDTDSIMIITDAQSYENVTEIGEFLRKRINSEYKFINISLNAIYSTFFLLQKKNYAGIKDSGNEKKVEIKGFIRGNNSELCQRTIKNSLEILLKSGLNSMLEYTKLYKNPEIEPFVQKILQLLCPKLVSKYFFLCGKNHKVFIVQNSELVTDCKECKGFINKEEELHTNFIKNIITKSLKDKVDRLYTFDKKCSKNGCQSKLGFSSGLCLKNQCDGIIKPVLSFTNFNLDIINLNEKVTPLISNTKIKEIYDKTSYLTISLGKYSRYYDYSDIFN